MSNVNYAEVNSSSEGVIKLSERFRKEAALNRVDIAEDWIDCLGRQVRKAAKDLHDPSFEMRIPQGKLTPVKLCADLDNGEGSVALPRWFAYAPPKLRLSYLRDWERAIHAMRDASFVEWSETLNAYRIDFNEARRHA